MSTLDAEDDPFGARERAHEDVDALSDPHEGARLDGEARRENPPNCLHFIQGNCDRSDAIPDDSNDAGRRHDCGALAATETAEQITRKERAFDCLHPVGPAALLAEERHEDFIAALAQAFAAELLSTAAHLHR